MFFFSCVDVPHTHACVRLVKFKRLYFHKLVSCCYSCYMLYVLELGYVKKKNTIVTTQTTWVEGKGN